MTFNDDFVCGVCGNAAANHTEFGRRACADAERQRSKDAEIARLRAELDAAKAEVLGHEKGIVALGAVIDGLRSDLSSARAALDKEREAIADEARGLRIGHTRGDGWSDGMCNAVANWLDQRASLRAARRAAEAKEPPHA